MKTNIENNLEPFQTSPYGDKFLYSVNRNAFCKMGLTEVYETFFGRDYFQEDFLYLIIGTDSGLLIKYLQDKGVPDGTRFILLELPEVIDRLSEVIDLETLPAGLSLVSLADLNGKFDEYRFHDYVFADRAKIVRSLCVLEAVIPEYYELFIKIKSEMQKSIFATKANLGSTQFWVQQLRNLAENRNSSICFQNAFQGKTLVLLAVGPSLEEILPWVKENRDNLVIMAVSRAARKLYQEGVVPHFIYTMDPTNLSFDVSREALHFSHETLLLNGPHSSPLIISQWKGRSFYCDHRYPWQTELNLPTLKSAGPTVTQGAFYAAVEMGPAQIILGGVDLCFSRDGQMYSSAIMGRERGAMVGDIPEGVETYGGWRAGTLIPYLAGTRNMIDIAAMARNKGIEVYNAAPGAMKLANIDFLPVDKIRLPSTGETTADIFKRCLPMDDRANRIEHYRETLQELERVREGAVGIQKLAKAALAANKCLLDPNSSKPPAFYQRRMDRLEKLINTRYQDLPRFLKGLGIKRFFRIIKPNAENWTDERIATTGRIYYESYLATIDEFFRLLNEMENRLQVRMLEESENADFMKMAAQWERDRQFGRSLIWQERNPEAFARLTTEELQVFARLKARFQKIMALEENLSSNQVLKKTNYSEMRASAQTAFRRGNAEALSVMIGGLSQKQEPIAACLANLAEGYRAELQGQVKEALDFYQKVIDGGHTALVEDALVRIVVLAKDGQDYGMLKLALECLTGLSPIYSPQYADLLWLLGEQHAALDVYADYLEKIPGDFRALLQLSRYYLALGSPEAARTALQLVLDQDPGNQTAQFELAKLNPTL